MYVETHGHSDYSILDGVFAIKDRVKRAKELGMPAVALTDHGNLHGAVEFYKECQKQEIKPIIGCEVYVARRSALEGMDKHGGNPTDHMVLLARNNTGYENLMKIVSWGYQNGFHYTPRVDLSILAQHSEGIIASTACLSGGIARLVGGWTAWNRKARVAQRIPPNMEEAMRLAGNLKDIFGNDGFFLEIQRHAGASQNDELVQMQEEVERGVYHISSQTGIPVIATNDSHFMCAEDAAAREIAFLIARGGIKDLSAVEAVSHSAEFYMKSYEQMLAALPGRDPVLLQNTLWIAEQCNVTLDLDTPHFAVPIDDQGEMDENRMKVLWEGKIAQGFDRRYGHSERRQEAWERLLYEKDVIESMGFVPYFIVTEDFVSWARKQDIPVGPGRGSAGGCLISYCLGITNLCPLEHGLIFERFLNPERVSMPDIDIDFCKDRVSEVIEYVVRKYGRERVARISAFGHMWAKQVFRDVGRVLQVPNEKIDLICGALPDAQGNFRMSVGEAVEAVPEVQELASSPLEQEQKLLQIAKGLEGVRRTVSTHACGVVIGDDDLTKYCALMPVKENDFGGILQSQLDMGSLESLGLIKYDFLPLDTLTVLYRAAQWAKKRHGWHGVIDDIPMSDEATYQLVQQGRTIGAFQIESGGMRELVMRVAPTCLADISAICALYRPGPMDAIDEEGLSMVDHYVLRKQGREPVIFMHEKLEEPMRDTYGVLVYQEQIMRLSQVLCGFTGPEADTLRKGVGKKLPEVVAKVKKDLRFIERAYEHSGIPPEKAEEIWHVIETFARYGFNKSHSTAYGLISYYTMYMKAHFPVEFMASNLTSASGFIPEHLRDFVGKKGRNDKKLRRYINECERMGIEVLNADVNVSSDGYVPEGDAIRAGLCSIKGVATTAAKVVSARLRAGGHFKDFRHLIRNCIAAEVNKKTIEALIKSGACDKMGERNQMLFITEDLMDSEKSDAKKIGDVVPFLAPPEELPHIQSMSPDQIKAYSLELLGAYVVDPDEENPNRVGVFCKDPQQAEMIAQIVKLEPGAVDIFVAVEHLGRTIFLSLGKFSGTSEVVNRIRRIAPVKEI